MHPPKKRANAAPEFVELDFHSLMLKIRSDLRMPWTPDFAEFLCTLPFDGRYFTFVYNKDAYCRVEVVCPKCGSKRRKLYKVKDAYACTSCHGIVNPERKRHVRDTIYTRYLRPLKKLDELMEKLADESLTPGRRRRAEIKVEKLLEVIPKAILVLRARIEKDKKG